VDCSAKEVREYSLQSEEFLFIEWKKYLGKRDCAMMNDRPLENARIREALLVFNMVCDQYDLTGAVCFMDDKEMGFSYHNDATWNAVVKDETLPLGFRIRIKEADLGKERAHEFAVGTAWHFSALKDFGVQTKAWADDILDMMKKYGIGITHTSFGGQKLPRLMNAPPRSKK
jgi:hypothetical protein